MNSYKLAYFWTLIYIKCLSKIKKFFWSSPCGSMYKVSKIVATTLNNPLSPLKTFDFALFQIPKQHYFNYPKLFISKL
jgi:hypothetical protein